MKIYQGYQFRRAVEEAAQKVCKTLGLGKVRIYWTTKTTTAGINYGGDLCLADIADDARLNEADLHKYMGFVVHELCHRAYTDFDVFYSTQGDYVKQLHNAVEDAFIEHKAIAKGVTGNVTTLLSTLIDRMANEALESVSDWADPAQYPFALAVYLRKHASIKVPLAEGLEPIFACAADELDILGDLATTADTQAIAKRVYDRLKMFTPHKNKPKSKEGDKKGAGKGQEGATGNDPKDGEGKGAGKPVASPAKAGKASAPTDRTKPMEVEPEMESKSTKYGGHTYSKDSTLRQPNYHTRTSKWADTNITVPAKLRYNVKRLFDSSGLEEFQRNRRSGAINVHALTKVGQTDRLFKRRLEVDGIDSAVVVVMDVSGSMFDDDANRGRIRVAVQAAVAMLDTLNKAQVASAVLTFGSSASVLKDWACPTVKAIAKLGAIDSGGSTNDYFAVRYAHEMLLHRTEQRKLVFVITDGEGNVEATNEQVKVGQRLGITTVGIGIKHDVSHVYPQSVKISDLADLGNESFKQIELAA
jgi:cobalamin biosynthesis protein CobT